MPLIAFSHTFGYPYPYEYYLIYYSNDNSL